MPNEQKPDTTPDTEPAKTPDAKPKATAKPANETPKTPRPFGVFRDGKPV